MRAGPWVGRTGWGVAPLWAWSVMGTGRAWSSWACWGGVAVGVAVVMSTKRPQERQKLLVQKALLLGRGLCSLVFVGPGQSYSAFLS